MHYIYCYTNKINQHKYVGQTNNLKRRIREHRSCAFNEKASSHNDLIHQKIKQYGEDNFQITVLEKLYTDDIDIVNKRERYWIEKLDTFCGNGKGYNRDYGGNTKHSSMLSDSDIENIKILLKKGTPFIDIQSQYSISASFISAINHGTYFYDEKETYPLHKYEKDNADYDELIDLLVNSSYSLKQIANMLGIGYSTVKKINAGTHRRGLYPTYPIRKKSSYEQRADKIKQMLLEGFSTEEIVKATGASQETVRRIKVGETFFDEKLSYPLGTCNDYLR